MLRALDFTLATSDTVRCLTMFTLCFILISLLSFFKLIEDEIEIHRIKQRWNIDLLWTATNTITATSTWDLINVLQDFLCLCNDFLLLFT